ncbi:MAG: DUF6605 domain-containing protein [Gaiellales bacterium]
MSRPVTRSRFVVLVASCLAALGLPGIAWGARRFAPHAARLAVRGIGRRYRGDRSLFATISPGVVGRNRAIVSFTLDQQAHVTIAATHMGKRGAAVVWSDERRLGAGSHELTWEPGPDTPVGTYVMRVVVRGNGKRRVYGASRPLAATRAVAPVVRVLGIEAAFRRRSFVAYEQMPLTILADVPSLTLTFLRCGHEAVGTGRNDEMTGLEMAPRVTLDWTGKRSGPVTVEVQPGDWPSGVYAARLEAPDGRVGFAPFVLATGERARSRQAVVVPTNTWQAYNFYDRDGDGWGDTWYAGGNPPVGLDRPFLDRGVPPRYRRYDLPFLRWLMLNELEPDFLAEDDVDLLGTGDALRARYDLIVYPGHTEYVTATSYEALTRFRDLGGRLIFLSANNFFWKVEREAETIRRARLWRDLGRPEAALLGAQYRANDDGELQRPFVVRAADALPWLFAGTGLENGSLLGEEIGGFGIEIDQVTRDSPPGTVVVASISELYGPGTDAHMTYYETAAGARVFSAGALDFSGAVLIPPIHRLLRNLWDHLAERELPPRPVVSSGGALPSANARAPRETPWRAPDREP